MHRIDTAHAEADANGAGKDGFNDGEPGVLGATEVDAAILNALQEEIANAIEAEGITLVKGTNTQLATALDRLRQLSARYAVTGTAVAAADKFALSAVLTDTGYSVASNEVTVPTVGRYLVSVCVNVENDVGGADKDVQVNLNVGADVFGLFIRREASATTIDWPLSGTFVVAITNTSTQKITLTNGNPSEAETIETAVNRAHYLSIVRLADLS